MQNSDSRVEHAPIPRGRARACRGVRAAAAWRDTRQASRHRAWRRRRFRGRPRDAQSRAAICPVQWPTRDLRVRSTSFDRDGERTESEGGGGGGWNHQISVPQIFSSPSSENAPAPRISSVIRFISERSSCRRAATSCVRDDRESPPEGGALLAALFSDSTPEPASGWEVPLLAFAPPRPRPRPNRRDAK